jgi:hypothetical protein
MIKSGDSLMQVLNDVLDLSKIEAGKVELAPVAVNLRDLVRATVVDAWRDAAAEKGLWLRSEIDPRPRLDPGRSPAHPPGADEPDLQRPEVHQPGRGDDPAVASQAPADGAPRSGCAVATPAPASTPAPRPGLRQLHPGRQRHLAQPRRHGPGPDHLARPGPPDGRRPGAGEAARRRGVRLHPARRSDRGPRRDRPTTRPTRKTPNLDALRC